MCDVFYFPKNTKCTGHFRDFHAINHARNFDAHTILQQVYTLEVVNNPNIESSSI